MYLLIAEKMLQIISSKNTNPKGVTTTAQCKLYPKSIFRINSKILTKNKLQRPIQKYILLVLIKASLIIDDKNNKVKGKVMT